MLSVLSAALAVPQLFPSPPSYGNILAFLLTAHIGSLSIRAYRSSALFAAAALDLPASGLPHHHSAQQGELIVIIVVMAVLPGCGYPGLHGRQSSLHYCSLLDTTCNV
ncbi:hypothetical protein EXIGLDRAFT_776970 [Exidia glandulosa HHB12029]|uniref:Uncharacterized protein n=1 Tax=Exidia glandulosa HHB12029 TaxID=1314781 RepID=A0A165D8U4_EXIGL|nr:hypothetical protein EXIGLDRAFT_776970 [Exidia glandulosa HHB12029]